VRDPTVPKVRDRVRLCLLVCVGMMFLGWWGVCLFLVLCCVVLCVCSVCVRVCGVCMCLVCVCVCVLCVCACVWNVHVQYYMVLVRVFASVWSRDVVVWWCVHVSVCLCVWECACAILRYDVLMMYSL
jgi:hypothetical protein